MTTDTSAAPLMDLAAVAHRLGVNQRLLILRKPFDGIEVRQLAYALTEKWELLRRSQINKQPGYG